MHRSHMGEGDIERLAELKAQRRISGWEQFKSPCAYLLGLLTTMALIGLPPLAGAAMSGGPLNTGVTVLVVVIIGLVGWFLWRKHKAWEKAGLQKLYEEELLELKLRKRRSVFRIA